jgi:hypothetical protein
MLGGATDVQVAGFICINLVIRRLKHALNLQTIRPEPEEIILEMLIYYLKHIDCCGE